jgi:hypothetical protein
MLAALSSTSMGKSKTGKSSAGQKDVIRVGLVFQQTSQRQTMPPRLPLLYNCSYPLINSN